MYEVEHLWHLIGRNRHTGHNVATQPGPFVSGQRGQICECVLAATTVTHAHALPSFARFRYLALEVVPGLVEVEVAVPRLTPALR